MKTQKKEAFFTKIDPELRDAMRRYKADMGVPEAQQVDRALRQWLAERGVIKPITKSTSRVKR